MCMSVYLARVNKSVCTTHLQCFAICLLINASICAYDNITLNLKMQPNLEGFKSSWLCVYVGKQLSTKDKPNASTQNGGRSGSSRYCFNITVKWRKWQASKVCQFCRRDAKKWTTFALHCISVLPWIIYLLIYAKWNFNLAPNLKN